MEIQEVILFFCTKKGVPPEEISRRGRNPNMWCTRYMIWYYLHNNVKLSAGQIGKIFDRNRPSVFRGIRIITEHMRYHKDVRDEYRSYIKELEGMAKATPSENMEEKD